MKWLFAAAALAAALALAGTAKAASPFDGNWRVTIVTQSGSCDPAYSYPLKISNGRVSYGGDGSFEIGGSVAPAGAVKVLIARGSQSATGTGKLSATSGSGSWRGKSSGSACAGRWEATRG